MRMKLTSYLVGGLCAALVALPAAGASNNQATGSGSQGRYQEFGDAGGRSDCGGSISACGPARQCDPGLIQSPHRVAIAVR